jgi:hypothetical protein
VAALACAAGLVSGAGALEEKVADLTKRAPAEARLLGKRSCSL